MSATLDGPPRSPDQRANVQVEAIYRTHAQQLLRFVRHLATERRLSEAQLDAEGVVQEAFALLLRYPGTVDNPSAWLFTVARRLVGRTQAGQRRVAAGDAHDHLDSVRARWTSLSRQASLEAVVEARSVMDAVATLPSRQRTATYLRHVQGWSLGEIAVYLDCAADTAGVHVHRGAQRIRRQVSTRLDPRRWPSVASAVVTFAGAALAGFYMELGWRIAEQSGLMGFFSDPADDPRQAEDPYSGLPWPALVVILAVSAVLLVVVRAIAWVADAWLRARAAVAVHKIKRRIASGQEPLAAMTDVPQE